MLTITATFDLTMLYFAGAMVLAIVIYVLFMKRRTRRALRQLTSIQAAVVEFFRNNGEQVSVQCIAGEGGKRFVALIDSLPSKRFRYSHVVAVILANHVRTVCGLELERIYWRFPIKAVREESEGQRAAAEALGLVVATDKYLEEGRQRLEGLNHLPQYKDLPQYEVTESSWDKFQELTGSKAAVC